MAVGTWSSVVRMSRSARVCCWLKSSMSAPSGLNRNRLIPPSAGVAGTSIAGKTGRRQR